MRHQGEGHRGSSNDSAKLMNDNVLYHYFIWVTRPQTLPNDPFLANIRIVDHPLGIRRSEAQCQEFGSPTLKLSVVDPFAPLIKSHKIIAGSPIEK